jgi:hypothetical protein
MGKIHLNHLGTWKEPTKLYVKNAGAWVEPVGGYKRSAGIWEKFYGDATRTLDLAFTASTTLDPRITFSRASLGTYYGSDGLLKYTAHNWFTYSQDFSQSVWVKQNSATVTADATTAPDGTTTADKLNHVTGTPTFVGLGRLLNGVYPAVISVYAKAGTKNWLVISTNTAATATNHIYFNLATGTLGASVGSQWVSRGIEDVGNGWYRCWGLTIASPSNQPNFFIADGNGSSTCTSPGDIYLWGAQIENVTTETAPRTYLPTTTAAYHAPRFDYDPVTHVAKGLLIEKAITNNQWYSQDLSNVNWVKTNATITVDQITAPDGTLSADLMTASTTASTVYETTGTMTNGSPYTFSMFLKKGTSDWVYIGNQAATARAWFNLATGTVGTVNVGFTGATIQDVGNGWYRCAISRIGAASNDRSVIGPCDANGGTTTTVGKTLYLWGAQQESSAYATSYTPAPAGSSVSRSIDVATMTGTNFSSWYNASAGTFVVEFDMLGVSGSRAILSADNNSVTDNIRFLTSGSDATAEVRTGNVQQATLVSGTVSAANAAYKFGASCALNDIAACLNGGTVSTDTTATMPTVHTLHIAAFFTGATSLDGHIRRIRFYNTAKSDAELQALTT